MTFSTSTSFSERLTADQERSMAREIRLAEEEALETIQSDNGYAATEPEERNSIVWTIGAGVNALKEGLITKDQAQTLLLKPFKYLAKKFPDAIIGVSAKDAATAIWDWLKAVLSP